MVLPYIYRDNKINQRMKICHFTVNSVDHVNHTRIAAIRSECIFTAQFAHPLLYDYAIGEYIYY